MTNQDKAKPPETTAAQEVPQADFDAVAHLEPRLDSRTVYLVVICSTEMMEDEFIAERASKFGYEHYLKIAGVLEGTSQQLLLKASTDKGRADHAIVLDDIQRNKHVVASLVRRVAIGSAGFPPGMRDRVIEQIKLGVEDENDR